MSQGTPSCCSNLSTPNMIAIPAAAVVQGGGGKGGLNLEAKSFLRPFLGQNDASRRPDDRLPHA